MTALSMPILDPAIREVPTPHGARYILPVRQLGNARMAGWGLAAFGLLTSGFMVFWILGASGILQAGWKPQGVHLIALVFAALGLPGLACASIPLLLGIAILLPNHSEITIDEHTLHYRECAGPLRWTFRRRTPLIRKLRLGRSDLKINGQPLPASQAEQWSALMAEGDFKRPLIIAPAYPKPLLLSLAQALAARCAAIDPAAILQVGGAPAATPPTVQIDPDPLTEDSASAVEQLPPQPASSRIVLLQDGPTTTFAIPPAGWKSPLAGLGCFGILWTAFTATFTVVACLGKVQGKHGEPASLLGILAFLSIFWAIGIGMILGALAGMFNKSVLVATPDFLLWSKSGLFGKKERQWERSQIASLAVGNSGTEVNNKPLQQLQLHLHQPNGKVKKTGIITGRTPDELEWIAALIRQTMSVPRS